jgi:hypothetical protein
MVGGRQISAAIERMPILEGKLYMLAVSLLKAPRRSRGDALATCAGLKRGAAIGRMR